MTGQSWGLSQSGQDRFSESCPSFSFLPTWLTTTFFFYPDHKTFSLIMQKDQMSNYFPFLSIHFILLHCRPNLHSYGQLSIIHSLYTQPFSWWREFTLSAKFIRKQPLHIHHSARRSSNTQLQRQEEKHILTGRGLNNTRWPSAILTPVLLLNGALTFVI